MNYLNIQTVTKENWRQIAMLNVSDDQSNFIESNAFSILESMYLDIWCPVGLYDGKLPVGFAMYGEYNVNHKSIWLDRFMIDEQQQGKKYGHHFLKLLLQKIQLDYSVNKIYLSFVPENIFVKNMYIRHGFCDTGKRDQNDEVIYMYDTIAKKVLN